MRYYNNKTADQSSANSLHVIYMKVYKTTLYLTELHFAYKHNRLAQHRKVKDGVINYIYVIVISYVLVTRWKSHGRSTLRWMKKKTEVSL